MTTLLGKGQIALTVDQGKNTKRYQSITNLEGKNLAECLQGYFRKSEQIPTSITLVAEPKQARAAALIVQKIPNENDISNLEANESNEEDWQTTNILMRSVSSKELLNHTISAPDLLFRLFNESGVQIYEKKTIEFKCHCSKENIGISLSNFSAHELDQMKTDEGLISATCEFCNTLYTFTKQKLIDLRTSNN